MIMKKLIKKLHLWLSLPLGIVISITCFTGAVLIFEKEITESIQRRYYYVDSVGDQKISFADAISAVEPLLEEDQRITGIVVSPDASRTWKVSLSSPKHAAVYVNQYSGEVLGSPKRLSFFSTMFRLHRWLMDTRPAEKGAIYWGKMIVGISTLACVILLLTGVVLWIPKSVQMLKNRSKISVTRGWRRFLYDLHVAGGIYATLLVLAMALTGLTWSFEWYREGLYKIFGAEGASKVVASKQPRSNGVTAPAAYEVAYDEVISRYDSHGDVTITPNTISVKLGGMGNPRAADKYTYDPSSGVIESVTLYDDAPRRQKMSGWIYSLHVGNWGGMVTRILWFLAAMLGATLPITGYYLWIKRSFGGKK